MFHVNQLILKLKNYPIDQLLFLGFILLIPIQLRILLNPADAYIGYYFSYPKAIWFYASDLLFIAFILSFYLFNKAPKRQFWPILLPICWALLSLFHVERLDLGIYGILKVIEFWLIIAYLRHSPNLIQPILLIIIISGIFQSILAVFQFHVQHDLGLRIFGEYIPHTLDSGTATLNIDGEKIIRAYGTMPHPNILGGFVAITLSLFLYVSRETYKLKDWIIVSCGTFTLIWGLTVSYSRSAWLAALVIGLIFGVYLIWKKAYKQAIIWSIIGIVSCGTLVFTYKNYVFPRTIDSGLESAAAKYRSDFNKLAIDSLKSNYLIGIGPYQYIPQLEKSVSHEPWQYQPPHNIVIYYLIEYGIIGLFMVFLTIWLFGFTWNNLNLLNIFLFLPIVILGMFDHYLISIQQGYLLFAICVGIMIANKKDVSRSVKHL